MNDSRGVEKNSRAVYVRNIIFGVEDSLVSTVGLLSGVAVVGSETSTIILTGMVLIFVEAFSMGVGSLISERSVEQYETQEHVPLSSSFKAGMVMFVSYVISGFIPLLPYMIFSPNIAFWLSVIASLAALFILGAISARAFRIPIIRQGLEMLVLGGIAIGLGIIVGIFIGR